MGYFHGRVSADGIVIEGEQPGPAVGVDDARDWGLGIGGWGLVVGSWSLVVGDGFYLGTQNAAAGIFYPLFIARFPD